MDKQKTSVTTANGNASVKVASDGTIHVTTIGQISVSKSPELRR